MLLLIVFMNCDDSKLSSSSPTKSSGCGTSQTSGTFDGTIAVDGTDRVYKIIVPDGYSSAIPYSIYNFSKGFHPQPPVMIFGKALRRSCLKNSEIKD